MELSETQIATLKDYKFQLVMQHNDDVELIDTINFLGTDNLKNIFNIESLAMIADGLKLGEEQFKDYKERGVITKKKDGEYDLSDIHAEGLKRDFIEIGDDHD